MPSLADKLILAVHQKAIYVKVDIPFVAVSQGRPETLMSLQIEGRHALETCLLGAISSGIRRPGARLGTYPVCGTPRDIYAP